MKDQWNHRYAQGEWAYGKEANEYLKQVITKLEPRDAWFAADGEGRNAVWAATLGWNCQIFDYAAMGAAKCKMLADEHEVRVGYHVKDLVDVELSKCDLIACSWFHTPPEIRSVHMPRILHSLRKGGHFVMEGYHKSQISRSSGGPKNLDLLFDLEEVIAELTGPAAPQMKVIQAEVAETTLDESDLHRGDAMVVRIHLKRV